MARNFELGREFYVPLSISEVLSFMMIHRRVEFQPDFHFPKILEFG